MLRQHGVECRALQIGDGFAIGLARAFGQCVDGGEQNLAALAQIFAGGLRLHRGNLVHRRRHKRIDDS